MALECSWADFHQALIHKDIAKYFGRAKKSDRQKRSVVCFHIHQTRLRQKIRGMSLSCTEFMSWFCTSCLRPYVVRSEEVTHRLFLYPSVIRALGMIIKVTINLVILTGDYWRPHLSWKFLKDLLVIRTFRMGVRWSGTLYMIPWYVFYGPCPVDASKREAFSFYVKWGRRNTFQFVPFGSFDICTTRGKLVLRALPTHISTDIVFILVTLKIVRAVQRAMSINTWFCIL